MRRGPLLMILASGLFTVMVGVAREARQSFSPVEVMWWRAGVAVPVAALLAWRVGWRVRSPGLLALRTLFGFAAMLCFFTAVKGLSLANATLLSKLQPILVAVLAPLWLGRSERAGSQGWLVLLLGFSGSAVLLWPELERGSWYGLWAMAGAFFHAAAHLVLRGLARDDGSARPPQSPLTLVFWFQLGVWLFCSLWLGVERGTPLPPPAGDFLPLLILCGMAGAGGQLLMTWAYRLDRAPRIAAAAYVSPLWALLGDLLAFGVFPGGSVLLGGALVVLAGLVLLRSPPRC